MSMKGNKYGTHRVIEPKGVLTQAAWKVDNDMTKRYSNEIICNVTSLNVDSASFTQISEACGGDEKKIGEMILGIVAERGKQQNPVTGSGGMFKGEVAWIGEDLLAKPDFDLKVGDKIVSLVSLSMTPLKIEKILAVHKDIDRVDIVGQAVLFESALYAKMPEDMSEPLALAALDVAGAPAQTAKEVDAFLDKLSKAFPSVPIALEDERFTSVLAHRAMIDGGMKASRRRDKTEVDKISAAIILQSYLDKKK